MPFSRAWRLFLAAAGIGLLAALAAIALVSPIRWRVQILLDKGTGRIHDVEWSDLRWLLKPGSPIDLKVMAETGNPFLAIGSPRHSRRDIQAGEQLFDQERHPLRGLPHPRAPEVAQRGVLDALALAAAE